MNSKTNKKYFLAIILFCTALVVPVRDTSCNLGTNIAYYSGYGIGGIIVGGLIYKYNLPGKMRKMLDDFYYSFNEEIKDKKKLIDVHERQNFKIKNEGLVKSNSELKKQVSEQAIEIIKKNEEIKKLSKLK